jgi:hypothetical protein
MTARAVLSRLIRGLLAAGAVLLLGVGVAEAQICSCGSVCDLSIDNETYTSFEVLEACLTIDSGENVVVDTGSDVTFRAGDAVVIADGLTVASSATFTIAVDAKLSCDDEIDFDEDTWDQCLDCNDDASDINPGETDICGGDDADCDPDTCVCGAGTSDCAGDEVCETVHATSPNSCASATMIQQWCGDVSSGFICGAASLQLFALEVGRTSKFFRGKVEECSDCLATIEHVLQLEVPSGIDYDLYVYLDSSCTTPVASSTNGTGTQEQVILSAPDLLEGDDAFDYWVEVRYYSGAVCTNWTLEFFGH